MNAYIGSSHSESLSEWTECHSWAATSQAQAKPSFTANLAQIQTVNGWCYGLHIISQAQTTTHNSCAISAVNSLRRWP